ncbi:MAG: HdeD family acid-resistance protein [Planctomycetota bacterium]
MSMLRTAPGLPSTPEELDVLRKSRGWFFLMGFVMLLSGSLAISWSCMTTLTIAVTWMLGWILLVSGAAEIVSSFRAGKGSGRLVHLFLGILYALVGLMVIDQPVDSAIIFTRFIAIFLIIGGIFRIVISLLDRFPGWGAVLLNGIVTFALGLMIYRQWPASGLWVIGMFFGVDLILNGWAWIMLAVALGKPARE